MPSKYGFGNTRKKSPYEKRTPQYGRDQKNPIKFFNRFRDKVRETGISRDLYTKEIKYKDDSPSNPKPPSNTETTSGVIPPLAIETKKKEEE